MFTTMDASNASVLLPHILWGRSLQNKRIKLAHEIMILKNLVKDLHEEEYEVCRSLLLEVGNYRYSSLMKKGFLGFLLVCGVGAKKLHEHWLLEPNFAAWKKVLGWGNLSIPN